MARGGEGRDPRSARSTSPRPGRRALYRARAGAREPVDAEGDARSRRALRRDRHSREPGRARAAVPVGAGPGRPAGPAADGAPGSRSSSSRRSPRSRSPRRRRSQGVWSWGWPSFSVAGNDPDKPAAACVYLWTRDPKLCDGPALAGAGFNASLTEGQIELPAERALHASARGTIAKSDVARAAALTGDLGSAATALLRTRRAARRAAGRSADRARGRARDRARPLRRQRRALPRRARCGAPDARRRARDHRRPARARPGQGALPPARRDRAQIADFISTYAATQRAARLASTRRRRGSAARSAASRSRRSRRSRCSRCRSAAALASTRSTAASRCARSARRCRCSRCRPRARATSRAAVLGRFAKDDVYQRWLRARETSLLGDAVCARDDVPVPRRRRPDALGAVPRRLTESRP